jgi:nitrate reductase assembly molybdenum cofactor insertion protein NarJ
MRLAQASEDARRAVEALAQVRAAPIDARRKRYTKLFAGPSRPQFWLYESMHFSGRLPGSQTFAVQALYRAAGLNVEGAELPDHASMELAFLAFLAERAAGDQRAGEWRRIERLFIKRHAGRWLPALGHALARANDEVYAPIGRMLFAFMNEMLRPPQRKIRAQRIPMIELSEACTLCGFCVQVCPTHALIIRETGDETALTLNPSACVACNKCEHVCETHAIKMEPTTENVQLAGTWSMLRSSPRAKCAACGQPLVSQAEIDFVAVRIGNPSWLQYCPECRPLVLEERR